MLGVPTPEKGGDGVWMDGSDLIDFVEKDVETVVVATWRKV